MAAADELRRDADRLALLPEQVVGTSLRTFAAAVRPRLRADTGGDDVLSGVGGRMTVTTRTERGVFLVSGVVEAGPRRLRGLWRWLNDGIRPHGPGDHPGQPPRRTWDEPIDAVYPTVLQLIDDEFRQVIP